MTHKAHTSTDLAERIAEDHGIAVVLLDGDSREVSVTNNNSICRTLTASPEFAPRCGEFCGRAFERAHAAGEAIEYECHAGLFCRAVPVTESERPLVAIIGRTYVGSEGYRETTRKAVAGEYSVFSPAELFENVLISGSAEVVRTAAAEVPKTAAAAVPAEDLLELNTEPLPAPLAPVPAVQAAPEVPATVVPDIPNEAPEADADAASLRSLVGSLLDTDHERACELVAEHIAERHGGTAAWFERRANQFRAVAATGAFRGRAVALDLGDDERLMRAAVSGEPIVMRERSARGDVRRLMLFPVRVGSEVRAAIGVQIEGEEKIDPKAPARLAKIVGPQIELLRLRDEASEREQVADGIRRLNDSLKRVDSEDFWMQVTRVSAEMMRSERASLLVRDDVTGGLTAKAAVGVPVDIRRAGAVGERVAGRAFESGRSLVVPNIDLIGLPSAPSERRYKTPSFISFPISIGERRLGVLNFADRADGAPFSNDDLDVLNAIAPQIAIALDRVKFKEMAGELEKRSITDPMTGLMNRGYMEERLIEEMNRANRYRFPASLLMIDVDHFKSYNDSFGHPAGDVALRLVAQALKRTLRAADVAARYGGEEFAVLLPQTPEEEAAAIAERIRQRIERTDFPKRQVTISIGVAGISSEFSEPKDWMTAADMALYNSKELGRNRVTNYQDMGRSFREKIN